LLESREELVKIRQSLEEERRQAMAAREKQQSLEAAMLLDSTRPVFSLRSRDAQADVPADIKDKLFVPYKSLSDPPQELEKSIRGFFERDGRPVHDDIEKLVKQRKKRFLSRTLLEQMHIKLEDREIREILNQFETVEDVLACEPRGIEAKTNLVDWKVAALCGELKGFLIHA
jgi:hypothetical protein